MSRTTTPLDSPFRRPYPSRRQRDAKRRDVKPPANKLLVRVLAALVVLLMATMVVIIKDGGKDQLASSALASGSM